MCTICSKLTIKTPEKRHQHRPGTFIVNFEQILNKQIPVKVTLIAKISLPSFACKVNFKRQNLSKKYGAHHALIENRTAWTEAATGGVLWKKVF